ncbi:hypothetical protein B0H19DRAFT_1235572 [Mycena capillaripes]|nr:hypothetical protein B0H19DRAFT_1235572 [Mycena capillaripes]
MKSGDIPPQCSTHPLRGAQIEPHACAKRLARHAHVLGTYAHNGGHSRDDLVLLVREEASTCRQLRTYHLPAAFASAPHIHSFLSATDMRPPRPRALVVRRRGFTLNGQVFGYGRECGNRRQNTERDAEKAIYNLGTEILVRRARGGAESAVG